MNKKQVQPVDPPAQAATQDRLAPNPAAEERWNEIPDLDPMDQYVIAHGEYPLSGDIIGPDVVDDTLLEAITQPNDRPADTE